MRVPESGQKAVLPARREPRRRGGGYLGAVSRAWWLVVPAGAFYLFVVLVPVVRGTFYSFTDWNGLSPDFSFVGLENFVDVLGDPRNQLATVRTVLFAAAITIFQCAVGLGMALAVNARIAGQTLFRVLFFMPVIIISVVTAFLWRFLLAANDGAINELLRAVGLGDWARPWLGDSTTASIFIVVVVVWQHAGITMAIFLAGLQAIPIEVIEASDLDGASGVRRFVHITWPLLAPAATVTLLLALISGLRLFDQLWILTNGGPAASTETLSVVMYRQTFQFGQFNEGVTLAVVLTVIVAFFAFIQYRWLSPKDKS